MLLPQALMSVVTISALTITFAGCSQETLEAEPEVAGIEVFVLDVSDSSNLDIAQSGDARKEQLLEVLRNNTVGVFEDFPSGQSQVAVLATMGRFAVDSDPQFLVSKANLQDAWSATYEVGAGDLQRETMWNDHIAQVWNDIQQYAETKNLDGCLNDSRWQEDWVPYAQPRQSELTKIKEAMCEATINTGTQIARVTDATRQAGTDVYGTLDYLVSEYEGLGVPLNVVFFSDMLDRTPENQSKLREELEAATDPVQATTLGTNRGNKQGAIKSDAEVQVCVVGLAQSDAGDGKAKALYEKSRAYWAAYFEARGVKANFADKYKNSACANR
jgi:hypothetical protein